MSAVIDQSDSEAMATADLRFQRYVAIMGAAPQEEEDVTVKQLSALNRRVTVPQQPPYVDMAVWLPFGRRALRASKFRAWIPADDGSYIARELPGPASYAQWLASWRVFQTAANILPLASREAHREAHEALPHGVAPHRAGGREGKGRETSEDPFEAGFRCGGWQTPTSGTARNPVGGVLSHLSGGQLIKFVGRQTLGWQAALRGILRPQRRRSRRTTSPAASRPSSPSWMSHAGAPIKRLRAQSARATRAMASLRSPATSRPPTRRVLNFAFLSGQVKARVDRESRSALQGQPDLPHQATGFECGLPPKGPSLLPH